MQPHAVRDPVVMAEWQRRFNEYRAEYSAKSRWLRLLFYGITIPCVVGAVTLGGRYLGYFAGLEAAMLVVVGVYLSKYSYRAPACPHCGKVPFDLYRIRQVHDHCYECGYWLSDTES